VRILARNFTRRCGELDIVALHAGELLVIEVRMRSTDAFGGAAASVGAGKRRRIIRTTRALLQRSARWRELPVRFDVIVVHPGPAARRIEWIQHAFQA
jgi:putative endonuclease